MIDVQLAYTLIRYGIVLCLACIIIGVIMMGIIIGERQRQKEIDQWAEATEAELRDMESLRPPAPPE